MERTKPPPPGLHLGVDFQEYLTWEAYNWSALKKVAISMEQFKFDWDHPDDGEQTPAQFEGTVLHAFVLEPDAAKTRYVTCPATYPVLAKAEGFVGTLKATDKTGRNFEVSHGRGDAKETCPARLEPDGDAGGWICSEADSGLIAIEEKKWNANATFCRAWLADMAEKGVEVVKADALARTKGMAERLRAVPDIAALLDGAETEVSVVWVDPQTGLTCKCRLDLAKGAGILDLKTSAMAVDNDSFARTVKKYGYAGQGAQYLDGYKAGLKAMGKKIDGVPRFVFGAVQSFPPYTPRPWVLLDDQAAGSWPWLEYGRQMWHGYLQQVAYCLWEDEWPGHQHEGQQFPDADELLVPGWMNLEPMEKLT